jgi:SAM-dependent methyltransferase
LDLGGTKIMIDPNKSNGLQKPPIISKQILLFVLMAGMLGVGLAIFLEVRRQAALARSETTKQGVPIDPREVHFVGTPPDMVNVMLEKCLLNENSVLYDLGCGDGRIVITAAKRYGCRGVGYDIDAELIKQCGVAAEEAGVSHLVKFETKDIFEADFKDANAITLYLRPHLNLRLLPQLSQLKPGVRIVSYDFETPGVIPIEHLELKTVHDSNLHWIYVWETPFTLQPNFEPEPYSLEAEEFNKLIKSFPWPGIEPPQDR